VLTHQGQRKAHERVEERKQRLNLPDTLVEDQPYLLPPASSLAGASSVLDNPHSCSLHDDSHPRGRGRDLSSKEQLAESRREARERYVQKQREEDAIVEANFRAERELQDEIKKKMDEKAKKLQAITTERVAKYKVRAGIMARESLSMDAEHSACCVVLCCVVLCCVVASVSEGQQARASSQGERGQGAGHRDEEGEGQGGHERGVHPQDARTHAGNGGEVS
jgi:hypothetical protein